MIPIDIGISGSNANEAAQNNPTDFNMSGGSSPVMWLVIGAIVIMGLVVWLKLKGKR
jgi:hypothetical protein